MDFFLQDEDDEVFDDEDFDDEESDDEDDADGDEDEDDEEETWQVASLDKLGIALSHVEGHVALTS